MTPKLFKENLKVGNVSEIEIYLRDYTQNNETVVYFKLRNHLFEYQLDRSFRSIISATKFIISALDNPIIDGLSPLYQAIPPIRIFKTFRRGKNHETSKHEPSSESKELP